MSCENRVNDHIKNCDIVNINLFLSIDTIPATIGANVLKIGKTRQNNAHHHIFQKNL
jgi:hypothetical protein